MIKNIFVLAYYFGWKIACFHASYDVSLTLVDRRKLKVDLKNRCISET